MPPTHHARLLLVEDDPALRGQLMRGLGENGYLVQPAADLRAARGHLDDTIDLVLLDLGLPDGDGLTLLEEIRGYRQHLPVLVLTARDGLADRVRGLDLGADDYLIKPFDFPELLARIRARLRRREPATEGTSLVVADLTLDLLTRRVDRGGRALDLTPREFDVLALLARHAGQPVSRTTLAVEAWKVKSRMTSMDNVIDVLMSRLREKVDGGETAPRLIHTVRGIGFTLREPA